MNAVRAFIGVSNLNTYVLKLTVILENKNRLLFGNWISKRYNGEQISLKKVSLQKKASQNNIIGLQILYLGGSYTVHTTTSIR